MLPWAKATLGSEGLSLLAAHFTVTSQAQALAWAQWAPSLSRVLVLLNPATGVQVMTARTM